MKKSKIRFLAFFLVITLLLTTAPLVSGAVEKVPVEQLVIEEGTTIETRKSNRYDYSLLKEMRIPSSLKILNGTIQTATALETVTVPYTVSLITKGFFPSHTVLRVENGSYAHRWAVANEQPFEIIEHAPSAGDYDADGLCTSTDARLLLQYEAGKLTFTEEQAAVGDVDGDGDITSTDARLVLQQAAEKVELERIQVPRSFNSYLFDSTAAEKMERHNYSELGSLIERESVANTAMVLSDINQGLSQCYTAESLYRVKTPPSGWWTRIPIGEDYLFFCTGGKTPDGNIHGPDNLTIRARY